MSLGLKMRLRLKQNCGSKLQMSLRLKLRRPEDQGGERERFRALLQSEAYRRHRDGHLETGKYADFMARTEDDGVVDKVLADCKGGDAYKANGFSFNWDDIIAWIDEHWFDILKLVLTIAILFLEPKPEKGKE